MKLQNSANSVVDLNSSFLYELNIHTCTTINNKGSDNKLSRRHLRTNWPFKYKFCCWIAYFYIDSLTDRQNESAVDALSNFVLLNLRCYENANIFLYGFDIPLIVYLV